MVDHKHHMTAPRAVLLVLALPFCLPPDGTASCQPSSPVMAERRYAVHDAGQQWLGMRNDGQFGNPRQDTLWIPELEYPGGSGTVFLFSGGLWVGAKVDGQPHVSTCTDGDNGTNEFGALELATPHDRADPGVRSVSWLERRPEADSGAREQARLEGRYLGVGRAGIDDDGDGRFDEDPAGDISADFLDNDGDGLIDGADPDMDGDLVAGSCDDDGDGLVDEDDAAIATQELVVSMVDTCSSCVEYSDPWEPFHPLGITLIVHSRQWAKRHADDFLRLDFRVTNTGSETLSEVCLGIFFDFDVGHLTQDGERRCTDDITYFFDDIRMAVGADDDGDDGLLSSRSCGVRFVKAPVDNAPFTYKTFSRITGGDPCDDPCKYALMSCGERDPDERRAIDDWRMILAIGPLGDLGPGETMEAAVAVVNGFDDDHLRYAAITAEQMLDPTFHGPTPPDAPVFRADPRDRAVRIVWGNEAEQSIERATGLQDFQGYNIWRAVDDQSWTLVATYDLPDTIGLNMPWPPPANEDSVGADEYAYEYVDAGLMNGARLRYAVTAFDDGNNGDGIHNVAWEDRHNFIGVLESSREEAQIAIPAEAAQAEGYLDSVYVVPNPFVGSSRMETGQRERLLEFRGLAPSCVITIYTLAGDLVRELRHTSGLSWEPWDLKSREGREIGGGVYLFRVTAARGERLGRFVVVQ